MFNCSWSSRFEKIATYDADEVWVFGSQNAGLQMGGSKAFWIGSPPLPLPPCHRRFPIMRFGADPLWDYGLRVERVLFHLYRDYPPSKNMFEGFTRPESCGTLLRPPNGILEGYASIHEFFSDCDDWSNYPNFRNRWRMVNSSEWGRTRHGFVYWWLSHIPQGMHKTDGIHDNWWHSIMNMDLIR